MNSILSNHTFCFNFVTKFLTFKAFVLDLRQILDLRTFVNPTPGNQFYTLRMHKKPPVAFICNARQYLQYGQ